MAISGLGIFKTFLANFASRRLVPLMSRGEMAPAIGNIAQLFATGRARHFALGQADEQAGKVVVKVFWN